MITLYNYEDKSKETLKEKCLSELNVTEEDIFTKEERLKIFDMMKEEIKLK